MGRLGDSSLDRKKSSVKYKTSTSPLLSGGLILTTVIFVQTGSGIHLCCLSDVLKPSILNTYSCWKTKYSERLWTNIFQSIQYHVIYRYDSKYRIFFRIQRPLRPASVFSMWCDDDIGPSGVARLRGVQRNKYAKHAIRCLWEIAYCVQYRQWQRSIIRALRSTRTNSLGADRRRLYDCTYWN